MIAQDHLRHLDGGIALHAERRAAAAAAGRSDDGGDRRPPAGYGGLSGGSLAATGKPYRALLPRKAMSEILKLAGEAGADAKHRFSGDDNHLFFQLGDRLLITRKLTGNFPDLRAGAAEGPPASSSRCKRDEIRVRHRARGAVLPTSGRGPSASSSRPARSKYSPRSSRPARAKRACRPSTTGPDVEIGFNAQYLLDFLRAIAARAGGVPASRIRRAPARCVRPATASTDQYRYVVMPMRI